MGFLDSIRDRLRGGDDDYYDDDYYEDDEAEDDAGYARDARRRDTGSSPRLLGNTPRPEAESVSVYTRSGRPVASQKQQYSSQAQSSRTSYTERPSYSERSYDAPSQDRDTTGVLGSAAGAETPADLGPRTFTRVSSGQLPPYVLKPVSYDDVQTVVRRVKTGQPVVLVFRNTNIDTAKRILDFCFGLSYGLSGEVEELGDRVFAVLPPGVTLSASDVDKLVADGDLTR